MKNCLLKLKRIVHTLKLQSGFSLIEMVTVTTIIAIVLPTTTSILITLLRYQARIYAFTQVKREGDYIYNYIKSTINNDATGIYKANDLLAEQCKDADTIYGPITSTVDGTPFFFSNKEGKDFQFYVNPSTKVFYHKRVENDNVPLSTGKVKIEDFSIYCYKSATLSQPFVGFSYSVVFNNQPATGNKPITLYYQGRLRLKQH